MVALDRTTTGVPPRCFLIGSGNNARGGSFLKMCGSRIFTWRNDVAEKSNALVGRHGFVSRGFDSPFAPPMKRPTGSSASAHPIHPPDTRALEARTFTAKPRASDGNPAAIPPMRSEAIPNILALQSATSPSIFPSPFPKEITPSPPPSAARIRNPPPPSKPNSEDSCSKTSTPTPEKPSTAPSLSTSALPTSATPEKKSASKAAKPPAKPPRGMKSSRSNSTANTPASAPSPSPKPMSPPSISSAIPPSAISRSNPGIAGDKCSPASSVPVSPSPIKPSPASPSEVPSTPADSTKSSPPSSPATTSSSSTATTT